LKYTFDIHADILKTENILDKEIRERLRTIFLYDIYYKLIQEQEKVCGRLDFLIDPITEGSFGVYSSLRIHSLFKIHASFKFSDLPEANEEQQIVEEDFEEHPLMKKKLLYKLFLNLGESTHTPNFLHNFYYLLSRRCFSLILEHFFNPSPVTHFYIDVDSSKSEPYHSLSWDIKTRKHVMRANNSVKNKRKDDVQTILRASIVMKMNKNSLKNEYVELTVVEDIIDGLKGTEFDAEKVHSIGTHIAQR